MNIDLIEMTNKYNDMKVKYENLANTVDNIMTKYSYMLPTNSDRGFFLEMYTATHPDIKKMPMNEFKQLLGLNPDESFNFMRSVINNSELEYDAKNDVVLFTNNIDRKDEQYEI